MIYRTAAAFLVLAASAGCSSIDSWRKSRDSGDSASAGPTVPRMAANRPVSAQDCSKPVELFRGNLRCK